MRAADFLTDPALLVLAAASAASWAIIIDRFLAIRRAVRADLRLAPGEASAGAPLGQLRLELQPHAGASREQVATIADVFIRRQRRRLEGSLPLLGVIGSTAPYVGLFGTVLGIIHAFQAIRASNTMSPAVVSGGISTALIATAAGLAVAIPAVAAHHLLAAEVARRVEFWEETLAVEMPDRQESTDEPFTAEA